MKKGVLFLSLLLIAGISASAQVGINADNSAPNSSAMLDVKSTTMGLLLPRMTFAQRNAIANPAEGLAVICTNCRPDETGCISIYLDGKWLNMAGTCDLPFPPTEGSHVQSNTQIIWNWNAVTIATGYKWSMTNDYASATDMGAATAKTETGLTTGTNCTRYVWAYNACGYSVSPTALTGQALTCGSSFTILHWAGAVSPVSKTVTYGTVTNIPGAASKCWITRNLGATQQPNTVGDNTEAAAGWYWQFNRKQGDKHDGTTRTPNTTWITPISENSDWDAANDPCSLLLGTAWRIPTYTEWNSVNETGNWNNWIGPWSSGLQMHAAGALSQTDGSLALGTRGSHGHYVSSTQDGANGCHELYFNSDFSSMYGGTGKANALSIRCIRD
jgi:hypothetical protein